MFGNNPFREQWAAQQVQEGKFVIPEEIPANERTAFHGAAAAAAKAGKKSFNFGGKTHPVTMKKDTANAIADDKIKEYSMSRNAVKRVLAPKPASGVAAPKPGNKTSEGYMKDLDTEKSEPTPRSDKKVAADFKKRRRGEKTEIEMNPKMDSDKKAKPMETKESTIREKLMAVLEGEDRKKHTPNEDKAEKMKDNRKGKGAQDMMAPADDAIANPAVDEPERIKQDAAKITSNVKNAKMRTNDNPKGDKNIIPGGTPMKDPAAMKAESYNKNADIMAAYASMYAPKAEEEIEESYTHEVDYAEDGKHTVKKFVATAKKSGIKAKIDNPRGPGGGHPVVHLGHKDTKVIHKFLQKHYDPDIKHSDLDAHKIGEAKIQEDHGSGTEDDYKYNVHGYTGERGDEGHHAMLAKAKARNVKVTTGRSNPNTGSSSDGKHLILGGKKKDVDHVIDNHIGRDE